MRARCDGGVAAHRGNAAFAARTATSTSPAVAKGTRAWTCPVGRVVDIAETVALSGDALAVDEVLEGGNVRVAAGHGALRKCCGTCGNRETPGRRGYHRAVIATCIGRWVHANAPTRSSSDMMRPRSAIEGVRGVPVATSPRRKRTPPVRRAIVRVDASARRCAPTRAHAIQRRRFDVHNLFEDRRGRDVLPISSTGTIG